jgi:hypothetical protein
MYQFLSQNLLRKEVQLYKIEVPSDLSQKRKLTHIFVIVYRHFYVTNIVGPLLLAGRQVGALAIKNHISLNARWVAA